MPLEQIPLSPSQAYLLGLSFTFVYVGSLYVSKNARLVFNSKSSNTSMRESNERWRDDPDVIRARITAVTIATVFCCFLVWIVVWKSVYSGNTESLFLAGEHALELMTMKLPQLSSIWQMSPINLWNTLSPYLLAPLLFFGPLYAQFLLVTQQKRTWSLGGHLRETYMNIQSLRDYVFAPITEEVVFRACIMTVYHLGRVSRNTMIWFGPLNFGVAHLHHFWDLYNRFGRTSQALKRAIVAILFQLASTTLFGAFCTFIFLRTASLPPVVFAHVFCNVMGFPNMSEDIRIGVLYGRGFAVKAAYGIGIVGFASALGPWTRHSAQSSFLWR